MPRQIPLRVFEDIWHYIHISYIIFHISYISKKIRAYMMITLETRSAKTNSLSYTEHLMFASVGRGKMPRCRANMTSQFQERCRVRERRTGIVGVCLKKGACQILLVSYYFWGHWGSQALKCPRCFGGVRIGETYQPMQDGFGVVTKLQRHEISKNFDAHLDHRNTKWLL